VSVTERVPGRIYQSGCDATFWVRSVVDPHRWNSAYHKADQFGYSLTRPADHVADVYIVVLVMESWPTVATAPAFQLSQPEANLGMFSMFGRTGAPTKRGSHKSNSFHCFPTW